MKSLTSKPGEFRATCKLPYSAPVADLDDVALNAHLEGGGQTRWDRKTEAEVIVAQCDAVFVDRAAFERHMAEMHDGGRYRWENSGLGPITSVRHYSPRTPQTPAGKPRPWANGLGLKPAGKPFRASTKDIARDVQTCGRCGLVAEVGDTQAAELWWHQHEVMCVALRPAGVA